MQSVPDTPETETIDAKASANGEQIWLVTAQISMNERARDSEKKGCDGKLRNRDGVRIVQPLADQNLKCW